MPTQVQFRRGSTAQNNNFTGAAGELSVNTSNNSIRVHDGSTAGGFELANMNRSLRQFASTTSSELRSLLSDETGTGNAVFSLSPTIQSPTVETSIVAGNTTFDLVNTTATTVNFAGAATTIEIGSASGTTNVNNNLEVDGDIQIDGGDLTFSTSTANIVNATSTTVNFAGAATTLSIGAGSGTTTVNNNLTVASNSLANNGVVTNAFTAGTLQTAGNVNGNNGNFITSLSAATLQTTGNLNAAAGLISGNFNATGNVNAVDGRFSTAVTSATVQSTGNVNGDNGNFVTSLSAGTLQSTGNVNTAGGLVTGNHTSANYQTAGNVNAAAALIAGNFNATGNVNAVDGRFSTSLTAATLQASGNVNAAAGRIAGNFSTTGILRVTDTTASTGVGSGAAIISGGASVGGNLYVGGNLFIAGTTTTLNSNVTILDDPILYLADNSTSDVLDLGFVATFNNGTQQHGGFIRDATDGVWKIFSGVTSEPNVNGTVDFTSATYDAVRMGALTASSGTFSSTLSATSSNVNTSGALFTGSATAGTLQTAGNVNGNNLRVATNSSLGTVVQGTWNATPIGLSYLAASTISGVSLGNNLNALSAGTGLSGSSYNGSATQTWTLATSGVAASTYGGSSQIPAITVDTYGRITSAANVATTSITSLGTISTGTWQGSSISTTYTDAKLTAVAATAPIATSASTGSITLSHTNSGVTGSTYGGASTIPVYTVNATGHITSASNVAIAISSGAVSGLATSATTDTTNATNITSGTLALARLAASTISGVTLGNNLNSLTAGTGLSGTAFNGSAAQTWTLATSGVTASTYGGAATVPRYTVDTYGRITSAANVAIAIAAGAVSGLATSATTDTTNATNITSGTLALARLAASTISGVSLGNNLNTLTLGVSGTGLSGSATYNGSGAATFTVTSNATNANTGSTIVARDASGNFSAGTITATLSGTATNATNSTVTDDTSTNATHYPNFVAGTSGNQGEKVSSTKLTFNPSSGLLTSTDYNSSSDKRLKKEIKTVEGALDTVNKLRGVTFTWKEGGNKAIGLIAQEVQKILPDVVTKDDHGYLGIRYTNLIGVLVEAIKEQQDQINDLKKQIEKLNG